MDQYIEKRMIQCSVVPVHDADMMLCLRKQIHDMDSLEDPVISRIIGSSIGD